MPEGTDPESVKNAARAFAKETFSQNHEYTSRGQVFGF